MSYSSYTVRLLGVYKTIFLSLKLSASSVIVMFIFVNNHTTILFVIVFNQISLLHIVKS